MNQFSVRAFFVWSLIFFSSIGPAVAGSAADWNHFEIKGIKLGMTLKSLESQGFKSGQFSGSYNPENRKFCKILNKRCDKGSGNVCKIGGKDEAACIIFFNGERENRYTNPVEYIEVEPSDVTGPNPRIYAIDYHFTRQLLKDDSPLGLALVKKYGKHCPESECYTEEKGGGRMVFKKEGSSLKLEARCLGDEMVGVGITKECTISAEESTDRIQHGSFKHV